MVGVMVARAAHKRWAARRSGGARREGGGGGGASPVGSIMSVPGTGQLMVGAWKP
jgi:hypothetical protein